MINHLNKAFFLSIKSKFIKKTKSRERKQKNPRVHGSFDILISLEIIKALRYVNPYQFRLRIEFNSKP